MVLVEKFAKAGVDTSHFLPWRRPYFLRFDDGNRKRMKGAVALILFAFMFIGCRSVRQFEPIQQSSFKVLSYNVNWDRAGADQVAEIIREAAAEIVRLQETTPEWERFLKRDLGAE